ncbi:uncharacterized protein LOC141536982 [Cotesia typhae]|uniref:uncharacterized protein LOC141536982 n=1 Tax=Cotesia typhae TaxID=2053667 RepID=UPI003D69476D
MDALELYYEMRGIIKAGDLEKMKEILDNDGLSYLSVWEDGYILLREACVKNHNHLAEYLLSKNAKINSDYAVVTPLQVAVMKNNKKLVKLLLDHGAKSYINKNKTPLQIAVERKNVEMAKFLFEHKSVKKSFHELSNTPEHPTLHLAVLSNEYLMVKLLLDNGFNGNINDFEGSKPIHLAIKFKLMGILELLLQFDVDVNAKNRLGCTPLFLTFILSYYRYTENQDLTNFVLDSQIVELLINYNADINMIYLNNCTPLRLAYTYTRRHFPNMFGREDNIRTIKVLITHIVKLKSQGSYVSARNLREMSLIKEQIFIKHHKKCLKELIKLVDHKIPDTNISLYDFITKNDNVLASCGKNERFYELDFMCRVLFRFYIYRTALRISYTKGVRRHFLFEESVKVFEKNWPHAANLLTNCLVHIFKNLNNNELREFIWTFK